MIIFALLALAAFVIGLVAVTRIGSLNASLEELKRRIGDLEKGGQGDTSALSRPSAVPPPLPQLSKVAPVVPTRPAATPPKIPAGSSISINWESIVGVKLFAWIGGLALFLGVVFWVKYAFDNNLITPGMRVISGAIIGMALIVAGTLPVLRKYRIPAESLCATGVLILYATTYSAYSFYGLIPLTIATFLMWAITGGSLALANYLEAQSVAWLGVFGGFLTPALLWKGNDNPVALFGYIGVLNFGIAAIGLLKRWNYLILLAAIGSVVTEFACAPDSAEATRNVFLALDAQFIAIFFLAWWMKGGEIWSVVAAALSGFAVFLLCIVTEDFRHAPNWDFIFPILLLANCGFIVIAVVGRSSAQISKALGAMAGAALILTWVAEWVWHDQVFAMGEPFVAVAWYVSLFLVFALMPYFCGPDKLWPWMIAAIAGLGQFWFVYQFIDARLPNDWEGLLPIAFAMPAAGGLVYLLKKERVDLSSGDSRLASQGAAVLAFVSLVFPVQFQREWITLGWAIEGVALILLFRWIPNRRLRAAALIVFCAAFIRLALNPAVLVYHPRSRTPILNWYLYAYGISAVCFILGARWFGPSREKRYELHGPGLLYTLGGITLFLLLNIEIADYFSIGPTLTFSLVGNFARDMTYTICWALFALALLILGMIKKVRGARLAALALLSVALVKLFLHDLDSLNQLYRIAAFISVAVIAIVASFAYQRFLSPEAKES